MPDTVPSPSPVVPRRSPASWQRELAEAFRDPAELCTFLGLGADVAAAATAAVAGFPLLVPRAFAARMKRGDPADPLLRQVLPIQAERIDVAGYSADPVAESAARAGPGLVRKYPGRGLVLVTGGCAVNCRYCFRREFPYAESGATQAGVAAALAAVAADPSLEELILSGGDPLLVDDVRFRDIVAAAAAIPHLRRLRIHTRLPVVLPARVTDELVDTLGATRLTGVVVIHANHAAELDEAVARSVRRLAKAPAVLLNQAVLLAGVNDSVAAQRALAERLVEIGVVPYYLHLLDRVRGAAHFDVPEAAALALHRELRESLPGYVVPRLVREVPGERAKVPLV
jgi:EF-P beta-lysylation protein EpmB